MKGIENQKGRPRKGETMLIEALARGLTLKEAARQAKVGETTAWRRWQEPAFRQAVAEQRGALLGKASGVLAEATGRAAETLAELLGAEAASIRLAAARAVLDQATRMAELLDLAERVGKLEAQSQAGKL